MTSIALDSPLPAHVAAFAPVIQECQARLPGWVELSQRIQDLLKRCKLLEKNRDISPDQRYAQLRPLIQEFGSLYNSAETAIDFPRFYDTDYSCGRNLFVKPIASPEQPTITEDVWRPGKKECDKLTIKIISLVRQLMTSKIEWPWRNLGSELEGALIKAKQTRIAPKDFSLTFQAICPSLFAELNPGDDKDSQFAKTGVEQTLAVSVPPFPPMTHAQAGVAVVQAENELRAFSESGLQAFENA
jgi:hypothetical protein